MTSHSNPPDEPDVAEITCDGCKKTYWELSALVWGRNNALIGKLLCIECDPTSEKAPRLLADWMIEVKD